LLVNSSAVIRQAHRTPAQRARAGLCAALALVGLACLCARTAGAAGTLSATDPAAFGFLANTTDPVAAPTPPCRLASPGLDLVPALLTGAGTPELALAQRAITRGSDDMPAPGPTDKTQYAVVNVEGWKSPAAAASMSFVVPGTGQLYEGAKRGYIYLGIEAVALATFVKYRNDSNDTQDQYYSYVGDPYVSTSRFSFERLSATAPPEEVERLRTIYAKDQREFYDTVSKNDAYAAGWSDPNVGASGARDVAMSYSEDVNSLAKKSQFGLFTMIANHLVSTVDALNIARFNNIALRDGLTVKFKLKPGGPHSAYGMTFTQKF
jgi:hypothetical protein